MLEIGVLPVDSSRRQVYENVLFPAILDELSSSNPFSNVPSFTFKYPDQNNSFLDRLNQFNSEGKKIIIGGEWSSQANWARSTLKSEEMILFSPTSTAEALKDPQRSHLFRLTPDDSAAGKILAKAALDQVNNVVILRVSAGWSQRVALDFVKEFKYNGGNVIKVTIFTIKNNSAHTQLDLRNALADFDTVIATSNEPDVGVIVIATDFIDYIVNQAQNYPELKDRSWFYSEDFTALGYAHEELTTKAKNEACQLQIRSVYLAPDYSTEISNFLSLFQARYASSGLSFDFQTWYATIRDIVWILLGAADKANSLNPDDIRLKIPEYALSFDGITGPCKLDEFLDRKVAHFDLIGFKQSTSVCEDRYKFGHFNPINFI